MTPETVFWIVVAIAAALVLDRVLLWMEARGWIYYRRNTPRGGGSVYHLMEMHSIFEPGVEEIIEVKVQDEREEDESGEPPPLGHPDAPSDDDEEK